jgi:hypothetical protein
VAIITRTRALTALLAALALLAVGASPAAAAQKRTKLLQLGCGAQLVEHPFSAVDGDLGGYVYVPNGGVEQGSLGWTLSGGARVVGGNEPYFAHRATDSASLYLPPGSSAISPAICVKLLDPTMRFFAIGSGSAGLGTDVLYRTILGRASLHFEDVPPGAWHATPPSLFLANLTGPILSLDLLTTTVQFRFSAPATGGAWQVDDVYVDPWLST